MSNYNLSVTFESILQITRMFLDILIIWLFLYYLIKIIRNNSRTSQIFKGILLIIIVDMIAKFLGLNTVAYFADIFVNWGFLAIIIVFQPEIRSLLEKLGKSNVFSRITTLSGNEKEHLVDQIVTATMLLSKDQTGALISVEQGQSLNDFIKTGTPINSIVTAELLTSIFVTSTPLHDGAVIIQGDRIACASAYFPPTNLDVPSRYGARHRAAIGISEITDAVTIVVSEETGGVSIAESGKIFTVNRKQLREYLMRVICNEETEVKPIIANKVKVENSAGDEYTIKTDVKTAPVEHEKLFDTAVLSKLAIKDHAKKLDEQAKNSEEAQGNVSQNINEEIIEIVEDEAPKKKKFRLFNRKNKEVKEVVESAIEEKEEQPLYEFEDNTSTSENEIEFEREVSEIKLPKKKERPIPSYPIHENNNVRVMGIEEVKPVEEVVSEEILTDVERIETKPNEFDTTSIDINKLMGFENELEDTFAMVDGYNVEKKKTTAAFTAVEEITPPKDSKGGVANE